MQRKMIDKDLELTLGDIEAIFKDLKRRDKRKPLTDEEKEQVRKFYNEFRILQSDYEQGEADLHTLSVLDTLEEEMCRFAYPKRKYSQRKRSYGKKAKRLPNLCVFYAVLITFVVIQSFIVGLSPVSGQSMYPTYDDGDFVLVQRKFAIWNVERGDVIILWQNGSLLIKRVIGLPGETVAIKEDNYIYINGEPINDMFGNADNHMQYTEQDVVLGDDEYFVMGDNRDHSSDSRSFGPIKKSKIFGKVLKKFSF